MDAQVHFHTSISKNGAAVSMGTGYTDASYRPARMAANRPPLENSNIRRGNLHVSAHDLHSFPQFLIDTIFIIGLSVAVGIAFHEISRGAEGPVYNFAYIGSAIAVLFAGIGLLMARKRNLTVMSSFDRIVDVVETWTFSIAALVFALFLMKGSDAVSRGTILSLFLAGLPLVSAWRVLTPPVTARFLRTINAASRACIIIGDAADPLLEKFATELELGGSSVPKVFTLRANCPASIWSRELEELFDCVASAARERGPGCIYVCAGAIPSDRLAAIGRALAPIPRAIFVVPDAQTSSLVRCRPASVGSHIALEVRREPLGPMQRISKRGLDIFAAAFAIALMLPLFAVIGILIKMDSKGPIFFRQTRNGYQGKPFKIWKFRSMHVQEDGPVIRQAQRDDPRVTRVGRFLRKSSLDELPQLINILTGDMSLVGPRPHAQAHDVLYARSIERYELRQHVKPGLTGWAQVNGLRGETATLEAMNRRIEFDLWYAVNASVLLDIEILARTAIEVFRDKSAY
jgi:undecaprenyl-phosphate galactose phosphotransferase/putative colanic acid biosynthesis UDP-glucose lipid carrier transferase